MEGGVPISTIVRRVWAGACRACAVEDSMGGRCRVWRTAWSAVTSATPLTQSLRCVLPKCGLPRREKNARAGACRVFGRHSPLASPRQAVDEDIIECDGGRRVRAEGAGR